MLVHLPAVELEELTELITESWRAKTPERILAACDAVHPTDG